MTRAAFWSCSLLLVLFMLQACGGGGLDDATTDTGATPTPTATPTPPGTGDTVVIGSPGLCTKGDVARVDFGNDKTSRFALVNSDVTCSPAKDNRTEEYTLILYNTTGSAMSFRIDSPINETPPTTSALLAQQGKFNLPDEVKPPKSNYTYSLGVTETNQRATELAHSMKKKRYGQSLLNPSISMQALAVNDEAEFRIRDNPNDIDGFDTTSGILMAQGTQINIFLDRKLLGGPVTVDTLTTTQLSNVASIFDNNIYPLVTGILGNPSDVDNDGRIHVLITPTLNRDLRTDSYSDTRDLLPFDPISNAGSNEAEVIYVFAPDSLGNRELLGNGVNAATYVSKVLNFWLTFQLVHLVSYNQHVLTCDTTVAENNCSAEDDWIDDGLGSFFADLAGFNILRPAAYLFLAQPHLDDLRKAEDLDYRSFEGAEYLFMLYYAQSQVDSTVQDADGDGFDDDLDFLANLMTSGKTGITNLENAVDVTFDSDTETEFQAIFKDWAVAVATSGTNRTDLQQSGQDAVKYFLEIDQAGLYGTGIADASGSLRVGADNGALDPSSGQNLVGLDLNFLHSENITASTTEKVLIENGDEHTYAPGNEFFGFVDPFSAMYVRLGGLFASTQTISIKASSDQIKGFLVRRSDISYPHVYSESMFGSIDQHAEDLDSAGPNPYWSSAPHNINKKVDLQSLIEVAAAGTGVAAPTDGLSQDYLTIVGRIDKPSQVDVCPEDTDECVKTDVPDTDKYMITIPDIAGRDDEGQLGIVLRRQFDEGSDESSLKPMLAIVSSKDVPYPYVPHPIRNAVNGAGTTDTRQQYRWLTSKIICGDDQNSAVSGDATSLNTNIEGAPCTVRQEDDHSKIVFEGFAENTGEINIPDSGANWDADIRGQECENTPNLAQDPPLGVETGGYGANSAYAITSRERSGSSLGKYSWSSSFMTLQYTGSLYPDVLFDRDFIKDVTGYPSEDPDNMYDPRSINGLDLNCHVLTGGDPDEADDSPDDLLEPSEIHRPTTLAQQILAEMARLRVTSAALSANPDTMPADNESATLATQYQDNDVFSIDGDSRDTDIECNTGDFGNNLNTFTVRKNEGSLIWGGSGNIFTTTPALANNLNKLEPHIANNYHNSSITSSDQNIYVNGSETRVMLTPTKNYTIIVAGQDSTTGNYELRIRKISPSDIDAGVFVLIDANNVSCDFEL